MIQGLIPASLFKHPLFLLGLLVRACLIVTVLPAAPSEWYVPFVEHSLLFPSIDPWATYFHAGGSELAFPYGIVMLLVFLPLIFGSLLLGVPASIGYSITLLLADILMLGALARLLGRPVKQLLGIYWFSPILLFATYWLGYNDLIPILLLTFGLLSLKLRQPKRAGIWCAAAVSAKLSMVLALPLVGIYLYRNKNSHCLSKPFIATLVMAAIVFALPFILSSSAINALATNPELARNYQWAIPYGSTAKLYLMPIVYALCCYAAWNIRRISFPLFLVLQGMPFFIVLLMTPAAPGWFIWTLPLLTLHQIERGTQGKLHVAAFSFLYLLCNLLTMQQPQFMGQDMPSQIAGYAVSLLSERSLGLLHSGLLALGIILAVRIWRYGIRSNDYFRVSRRPLMLGIAGDSGAGKDTLVAALSDVFGTPSVAMISGDDYHLWDRNKPMWQVMTHLNPQANDLEQFARDALQLSHGKNIHSRHYDHGRGQKEKPHLIRSNDVILVSGLHALYPAHLRAAYDISIFLDIDESLRRYFKIRRDVHQRGHSLENVLQSMERRAIDAERFIQPQAKQADLVLSLQPIHPRFVQDPSKDTNIPMKLSIRARNSFREEALLRNLVGLCGLHADLTLHWPEAAVEITVEGDVDAEDIAFAAQKLLPDMADLLSHQPQWQSGMLGIMQLVVLTHTQQMLQERMR